MGVFPFGGAACRLRSLPRSVPVSRQARHHMSRFGFGARPKASRSRPSHVRGKPVDQRLQRLRDRSTDAIVAARMGVAGSRRLSAAGWPWG